MAAKTNSRRIIAAEAGLSYQKIADHLGVSAPAVFKMVKSALRELNAETAETAEEVRRLELERLDEWQTRVAKDVQAGNVLPGIDRGIRLIDRRAKLLGLDAPQRNEISGRDGGPVEVTDARARLMEAISRRRRAREVFGDLDDPSKGQGTD